MVRQPGELGQYLTSVYQPSDENACRLSAAVLMPDVRYERSAKFSEHVHRR